MSTEATFTQCPTCGKYVSGPCKCEKKAEKPAKKKTQPEQ
jgi:hypothetical protein